MRVLFKVLLVVFALLVVGGIGGYLYVRRAFAPPVNQLSVAGLPASCSFAWKPDSTSTPAIPHASLLVPVQVAGCSRVCYLQFDTGAPYTLLYAHSLAALRAAYPTTATALLPRHDTLYSFRCKLGRSQLLLKKAPVLAYGAGRLPADTATPFIIGTLGADVLAEQVLVLDYPHQRFSLYQRLPDSLAQRARFTELDYSNRRVLVRAGLQHENKKFMFDSGSSAFSLLTNQDTWHELAAPHARPVVSGVNSWGKTLTSHTVASAAVLQIDALPVPLRTVTYLQGVSFWQQLLMQLSGMGGMLGNEPFVHHTVLLDARNGRFGLIRP